jgi:hypothetical protein
MALLIVFLYGPLVNSWFLGDDTQWIWFSAINPLTKIFFDSGTYLYINDANFTPMLAMSFKLDWLLFHMNPAGYNLHSLIALFASAVMMYLFLGLYTGRIVALSAVVLFILSPATAAVTSNFSIRHYMIGMFWALMALYMHERSQGEQKTVFWFISVCSYMIASVSKEVYLLLPAFMFLITTGTLLQRFKKTLPFWIVLLLYLPWRWYMLGNSMGGYYFIDWTAQGILENALLAVMLPVRFIYGDYWFVFVLFVVLISIGIIMQRGGWRKYFLAVCMYGLALAPVVPVMAIFIMSGPSGGRYAFFVTAFMIAAGAAAYALKPKSRLVKISISLLMLFSLVAFYGRAVAIRDAFVADRKQSHAEALRFIRNDAYMEGHYPVWFHDGLRRIYRSFYQRDIRTQVYYENALRFHDRVFIEKVKGDDVSSYVEQQKNFRQGPLDIALGVQGRTVIWEISSQDRRFFNLLIRKENEFYYLYPPVKNSGRHTFAKDFADNEVLYVRIFYRLPDGSEVVSPEIRIVVPGTDQYRYTSPMGKQG